eukprot:COSAG05_NODE_4860_length_1345_cov_1.891653_1_plen_133_part_00
MGLDGLDLAGARALVLCCSGTWQHLLPPHKCHVSCVCASCACAVRWCWYRTGLAVADCAAAGAGAGGADCAVTYADAGRAVRCAIEVSLQRLPSRCEIFFISADLPHGARSLLGLQTLLPQSLPLPLALLLL